MMTFPTEWKNWKNKKCAKPPTRISATGAPKDPIPNDATQPLSHMAMGQDSCAKHF